MPFLSRYSYYGGALLAGWLALSAPGCVSRTGDASQPEAHEDERDHEHDHFGHGDRRFADGFQEEWREVEHAAQDDRAELPHALAEFREAILLMSRLAADSDLTRKQWEQFRAVMTQVLSATQAYEAQLLQDPAAMPVELENAVREAESHFQRTARLIELTDKRSMASEQ